MLPLQRWQVSNNKGVFFYFYIPRTQFRARPTEVINQDMITEVRWTGLRILYRGGILLVDALGSIPSTSEKFCDLVDNG